MKNRLTPYQLKEIRIIATFTKVWCSGHGHASRNFFQFTEELPPLDLCPDCTVFMGYAVQRLLHCPLKTEKTSCKHCHIHCYATEQRALVKRIMAWSGRRMILRGRLDYLWHYFF